MGIAELAVGLGLLATMIGLAAVVVYAASRRR
jgi:hypothetical protein